MKLSSTQLKVLRKMVADDAYLMRFKGGFWATLGTPYKGVAKQSFPIGSVAVPEWWVGWTTVRSLEKRGLIERCGKFAESEGWKDQRKLTEAGRKAVAEAS